MSTQAQRISQFKSNVIDKSSLARSNIFEVSLDYPALVGTATKDLNGAKIDLTSTKEATKFLVRAAQLPVRQLPALRVLVFPSASVEGDEGPSKRPAPSKSDAGRLL